MNRKRGRRPGANHPLVTQPCSWDRGRKGFLGKSWDVVINWPPATLAGGLWRGEQAQETAREKAGGNVGPRWLWVRSPVGACCIARKMG